MINVSDILNDLRSGKTVDQLAAEVTDALNLAQKTYAEEQKKAVEEAERKAAEKAKKDKAEEELQYILNDLVDWLNENYGFDIKYEDIKATQFSPLFALGDMYKSLSKLDEDEDVKNPTIGIVAPEGSTLADIWRSLF